MSRRILLCLTIGAVIIGTIMPANVVRSGSSLARWPLDHDISNPHEVWGTYGDARVSLFDVYLQQGIDIHQDAGSPVYPVKNGLYVISDGVEEWGSVPVVVVGNGSQYYLYGHIDNDGYPPIYQGMDLLDIDSAFCRIDDSLMHPHIEFWLADISGPKARGKSNPLWQDAESGYEYLYTEMGSGPEIYDGGAESWWKGVAVGVYSLEGVFWSRNQYYKKSAVAAGDHVDVMVFAHSKVTYNWHGPVGVCKMAMWYEVADEPTQTPDPEGYWNHRFDFTKTLPSDSDGKYVFAAEDYDTEPCQPGDCVVIPRTIDSTDDDRMWYIITNFGSADEVNPDLHIGTSSSGGQITYQAWFMLDDCLTDPPPIYGPMEIEIAKGPTGVTTCLTAVSTENGIVVGWCLPWSDQYTGTRLSRQDTTEGTFSPIEASMAMVGDSARGGQYLSYLDPDVVQGPEYAYRTEFLNRNGDWETLGGIIRVAWSPPVDPGVALQVVPNPSRASCDIRLGTELSHRQDVLIQVFNAAGQEVWTSAGVPLRNGSLTWDGTGKDGARVAPGTYFCRLSCGEYRETVKLIRLK